MARALMVQGTGSDVGKSVLVAGLCRVARNRGLIAKPFKPQNMSNNAAVAGGPGEAGGEIGRAQWLQAIAAGAEPSVHMNPVLLKPQTDTGAQVVVQGKVLAVAEARDYQNLKGRLMGAVLDSFARLHDGTDLIIVEGAGSPAEINLRDRDIANMGFARAANVPVVLAADIDRGGVIAALAGTHAVLDDADRAMIGGYLINKFRGDVSLFDDGILAIGAHTGWPCFGVVPWLKECALLPAEDGVALERMGATGTARLTIAVPMLSRIANFDDLDPLAGEDEVEVVFVPPGRRLPAHAQVIIIPGSKSTIGDLVRLRENGWDRDIAAHLGRGGAVLGICGGYQMLGQVISDPQGIEGPMREAPGLGLLNITTVIDGEKSVRNVAGHSVLFECEVSGYEIHTGKTAGQGCERPFAMIDGVADGAISANGQIAGTYLHGLFAGDEFRAAWLMQYGVSSTGGYRQRVDKALDAIADELERVLDIDALLALAR